VTTMEPGWGYWILSTKNDLLNVGGSLLSPAMTPPSVPVVHGWNLLGYYGTDENSPYYVPIYNGPIGNGSAAQCVFDSIAPTIFDKGFTSLWGYWEPYNPSVWQAYNRMSKLDAGAGYWVFATEPGIYAVSTTCDGPTI
jgi:hypothetical protein